MELQAEKEKERERALEKPPTKLLDKSIFGKGELEELLSDFSKQIAEKKDEFLSSLEQAEEYKERLQKEISTMEVVRAQWGKVVYLNVGGRHFDVALSTLTERHPYSMLAVMFSGRHEVVKEPRDDRVFIDRDPDTFKHVISFLRLGEKWVAPTEDPFFINRLKVEFDFFDLPFPMTQEERRQVKLAKTGFVRAGTLLTPKHAKLINGWTGTIRQQNWTLLYQATRDGFEANTFHNMCDGQGPTLVVLRSNGYLFGGFTPAPWSRSGAYVSNASTFLFTLTNPHNIQPTKLAANVSVPNHTYCHAGYGPTFGGGHDLYVQNGSGKAGTQATSNFPHSFFDSTGKGGNLWTGSTSLQINEVEVYAQTSTQAPFSWPSPSKPTPRGRPTIIRRARGK